MASVTIAIPSFRRPQGLARLLASLAALQTTEDVRVLVGDNDAQDQAAAKLCRALAGEYRWPLEAIIVHERGIAQNRSALVAHALSDPAMTYLAMLDDDEVAAPGWLDAMLDAARRYEADAVEGPVHGLAPDGAALPGYTGVARHRAESGPVRMLVGAGNILLARAALERLSAPHFDPQFALSGGEDRDFFLRMAATGAHFAWCAEALSYTEVPDTRRSFRWTLSRAYYCGNTDMRIFLKHNAAQGLRAREAAKIALGLMGAPIAAPLALVSPTQAAAMLRLSFRAAGKLSALMGIATQEYAVIHGH